MHPCANIIWSQVALVTLMIHSIDVITEGGTAEVAIPHLEYVSRAIIHNEHIKGFLCEEVIEVFLKGKCWYRRRGAEGGRTLTMPNKSTYNRKRSFR